MSTEPIPDDPIPQAPREPDVFDCCNTECGDACVWEIYRLAKLRYERELEAWQIRSLERE